MNEERDGITKNTKRKEYEEKLLKKIWKMKKEKQENRKIRHRKGWRERERDGKKEKNNEKEYEEKIVKNTKRIQKVLKIRGKNEERNKREKIMKENKRKEYEGKQKKRYENN